MEAVFGELISRYNPIPVDRELKYGLYDAEWKKVERAVLDKENLLKGKVGVTCLEGLKE